MDARELWYHLHHTKRFERWREHEMCRRRIHFRIAVREMFVRRAVRIVYESNLKLYERILRNGL